MRLLAKELRISVITTKRAYEELEREGFLTTVPGKGCFVAPQNPELVREDTLRRAEEHLSHAVILLTEKADRLASIARCICLILMWKVDSITVSPASLRLEMKCVLSKQNLVRLV